MKSVAIHIDGVNDAFALNTRGQLIIAEFKDGSFDWNNTQVTEQNGKIPELLLELLNLMET